MMSALGCGRNMRRDRGWIRRASLYSVLVVALLGSACERRRESQVAHTRQEGDTTLVQNEGVVGRPGTFAEVFSIGQLGGDTAYVFGTIRALAVDADGALYVSELRGGIRLYDRSGRFVRHVARRGQGPGEVEYVTGMDVLTGGRLLVRDDGNARYSLIAADGGVVSDWRVSGGDRPTYGRDAVRALSDLRYATGVNPPLPSDGTGLGYPRPVYTVWRLPNELLDTIRVPSRVAADCPTLSSSLFRSGWIEDVRGPYVPKVKWALSPRGELVVGCPASFTYEVLRTDGSVLRVSKDWTPVPVSRQERMDVKELVTYSMRESGFFSQWTWTGDDLPDTKPAYHRIWVADDGRVWLWLAQASVAAPVPDRFRAPGVPLRLWSEPPEGQFEVFEEGGFFVGTVTRPTHLHVSTEPSAPDPIIRGDTMWAVTTDSLGVQYVTRFEVRWGSARVR